MPPPSVRIMGILNLTPDSFSDGGKYDSMDRALVQFEDLLRQGSDLIDLGAESSRPGSLPIREDLEWQRLEPLLSYLEKHQLLHLVSVDTNKPSIMKRCAEMGVRFINNIDGLCDEGTLRLLAGLGVSYVAMHKHGDPQSMQTSPLVGNECVDSIRDFFYDATKSLEKAGFLPEKIWLDPGIGFGKSDAANLIALKEVVRNSQSKNFLVGVSRKSWIGRILGIEDPLERDSASKMIELGIMLSGVAMIRTHQVAPIAQMRRMLDGDIQ